jgi:hypothetical protein
LLLGLAFLDPSPGKTNPAGSHDVPGPANGQEPFLASHYGYDARPSTGTFLGKSLIA